MESPGNNYNDNVINARDLNKFAGMHIKGQLLLPRATGCRKKTKEA